MLTDEEVSKEIRRLRREDRRETLLGVVEEAVLYDAEMQRDDNAYKARLNKREDALRAAIEHAYKAMHPGDITKGELAHQREIMEARLCREEGGT